MISQVDNVGRLVLFDRLRYPAKMIEGDTWLYLSVGDYEDTQIVDLFGCGIHYCDCFDVRDRDVPLITPVALLFSHRQGKEIFVLSDVDSVGRGQRVHRFVFGPPAFGVAVKPLDFQDDQV